MNDTSLHLEHFVTLRDGLKMYCREYGAAHRAGPAVLCLPGLTRNSRDFESLARGLSDRWRVLTPDLRGRGRSDHDPNWQQYQPMTYVADVGELLQQRGESRVVVIGTSLGGLVAMLMAALNPAALAGVVLNDVGPEIDPAGIARIAGYVGRLPPVRSWEEAAAQARLVNGAALPDFTEDDWMRFARAAYRDDGAGRPVLDMDPRIGDAMREVPAGAAPDLWPLFGLLAKVPALAIRGDTSDILSAATFARMAQLKPDLRTLVVPGRGHAPTLDEPVCRSAIRAFLESIA
ncbi:MAG: alpha/beta hydrolase [Steroidobacteraceae bacterium]|jgi:pimeloyl-ACP methyl ester carboxylesterase|nr:alpha/beta hydrolase [Steroidobacteraceae bacterium]